MKSTKRIYFAQLNKLAIATIVMLILFSCTNKEQKDDWEIDGLKGKIKSYTQFTYEAIDRFGKIEKGEMTGDFSDNIQMIYDEKGNKIEENEYERDGSLKWKHTYKYNEKGNKIEENVYERDGRLKWRYAYKYDEKGNKIEKNVYERDGRLKWRYAYKYDEKGNKIEENEFSGNGWWKWKHTYKYDEKGNKIEIVKISSPPYGDFKRYIFQYEYDKQKNWTKKIEFENNIPKTITERKIEYYE